jgi:hypothetical protein
MRRVLRSVGAPFATVGAAYIVHAATDFGANVDVGVYGVIAQVIPVLLLALTVELATAFPVGRLADEAQQVARDFASDQPGEAVPMIGLRTMTEQLNRAAAEIRWFVRAFFVCAAVGEVAALYAVGSDESSTFLLVLCAYETAVLCVMLAAVYERRFKGLQKPQ